jgi:hypothetical protein
MTIASASVMLGAVDSLRRITMPPSVTRSLLAGFAVVTLLPACSSVPSATTSPPVPAAPVQSDEERYPPPRTREPPPAPIESGALPVARSPAAAPPSTSAPSARLPAPKPMPPPTPPAKATPVPSPAPSAGATPTTQQAAKRPVPTPADVSDVAPGRWSVQVGVFAVAQNAQTLRTRVETRLNAAALPRGEAAVRTVSRDGRTHVVVGDLADRASAQRMAAQLRDILQQDVVLFRW